MDESKPAVDNEMVIYDADYAEKYTRRTIHKPYTRYKFELIAEMIARIESTTILDIGCGIDPAYQLSLASRLYVPYPMTYTALDTNENIFQSSEKYIGNIALERVVSDAHNLPFNNSHFDMVILSDALEHLTDPSLVLKESARVLSGNRYLILILPSMYKLDILRNILGISKAGSTHINYFDQEFIRKLASEAGFKILKRFGISYTLGLVYLLWLKKEIIGSEFFQSILRFNDHFDSRHLDQEVQETKPFVLNPELIIGITTTKQVDKWFLLLLDNIQGNMFIKWKIGLTEILKRECLLWTDEEMTKIGKIIPFLASCFHPYSAASVFILLQKEENKYESQSLG